MALNMLQMADLDLEGKRVLIREDLNVPVKDGKVTSDARIRAALPTIRRALEQGARVLLMSHLGRPVEGEFTAEFSLQPVVDCLSQLLQREVRLISDWRQGVSLAPGELALMETCALTRVKKQIQRSWHSPMRASAIFS